jgi:hypothetical protein
MAEPEAVAFLTRLAGKTLVKNPKKVFAGLTWTALDVGVPDVETLGMTCPGATLVKTDK